MAKQPKVIEPVPEIIRQLEDLQLQATTERSHYYVAATCSAAIEAIKLLMLSNSTLRTIIGTYHADRSI